MPCYTKMTTFFVQGVLWLCLLNFGFVFAVMEPGYLDFDNLPDTNFSCVGKVIGGYYADLETNCQMFHVCTIGQLDEPMDIRFLCLNGTVFDQETRVCERVDEVDCSKSERFYHLNLELYGNTAPPIVEEPEDTESPIISTTSTTTTSRPTTATTRTTRASFYTTQIPTLPPTTHSTPKVITSNQFPINSGPDIRFNPEEINFRLTPGSPPIIKTPSVSYQQHAFNGGDARITVTTHTPLYKDARTSPKSTPTSTTQKPKSVVSYGLQHTSKQNYQLHPTYDYSYQQTENADIDYHTDLPSSEYSYESTHMDYSNNYQTMRSNKKHVYSGTTTKRNENSYLSSTAFSPLKPLQSESQQDFAFQRTDKPPRVQIPLPIFPTLPPLTFSSPAPFSLTRHFETKRSNDHQRPRIIVSASASVSDDSGRRLNYSLGTIGTSHLIGKAPHSYDEYKEDDVGRDPFYHDVPKVKNHRRKRDIQDEDIDNSAREEISTEDLNETTHWTPPDYVDDNYEPLTYNNTEPIANISSPLNDTKPSAEEEYEYYYEYIDDNYEPETYNETTTDLSNATYLTTSEINTEPSADFTTQETTLESNTVTELMMQDSLTEATTEFETEKSLNEVTSTTTEYLETTYYDNFTTTSSSVTENFNPDYITTTINNLENDNNEITTTEGVLSTPNPTTTEISETTLNSINAEQQNDYTTTLPFTDPPTTVTDIPTTTTNRYNYLRTREPAYKRYSRTKPTSRHRFSSPSIHMSASMLKLANKMSNPSNQEETIAEPTKATNLVYEDVIITEASLSKSANPTEPKTTKSSPLLTTPISKTLFIPRRFTYDVTRSFNCFGKQMNKFYEDPRDCRLFHYCTPGYSETQVLDMKFVCDYGTYFNSDKLICSKVKPQRCK